MTIGNCDVVLISTADLEGLARLAAEERDDSPWGDDGDDFDALLDRIVGNSLTRVGGYWIAEISRECARDLGDDRCREFFARAREHEPSVRFFASRGGSTIAPIDGDANHEPAAPSVAPRRYRADPRRIVGRLDPQGAQFLQDAVVFGAGQQHASIEAAHLLREILRSDSTPASQVVDALGADRTLAVQQLDDGLARLRRSEGRPVFDEGLFEWIVDAWILASVDGSSAQVDSGHLLAVWTRCPHAYSAARISSLEALDPDEVHQRIEADSA
jgi:hypothetical protein